MANDSFKIVANLDIPKSLSEINKSIEQLQSKVKQLSVVAGIDESKSLSKIQAQLNSIKTPVINIGINANDLKSVQTAANNIANGLTNVQNQAQQTATSISQIGNSLQSNGVTDTMFKQILKDMQINNKVTDEYKSKLKTLLVDLKSAWNTYDIEKYDKTFSKVINTLISGQKQVKVLQNDAVQTSKTIQELNAYQESIGANLFNSNSKSNRKVFIDGSFRKELEYQIGSAKELNSLLNKIYGVGNWTFDSNNQIKGFKNLKNCIDTSSASLTGFETLFENFSRKHYGGNGFAEFFVEVTNKIQSLKALLNDKTSIIDAKYNSASFSAVNKDIESTIAKIIELQGYSNRIRVGNEWFDEVLSEGDIANNKINELSANIERAKTSLSATNSKKYFSNSSKILGDIQYFNQAEGAINSLKKNFESLGATVTSVERKSNKGFVNSFIVSVRSATGEIENFNYSWKNLNAGISGADADWRYALTNITASDKAVQRLATSSQIAQDKLNAMADTLNQKLMSVYQGGNLSSKPIKDSTHWNNLAKQAETAITAIEKLRNADKTTATSIKANAEVEIEKLKQLMHSYQNVEYVATSLRTKDLSTNKTIQTQELDKFINKLSNYKPILESMNGDIASLKSSLNNIFDANTFTKFLNELDIAKSKFESLKTMYQTIGGYDKQLNKLAEDWKKQGIYTEKVKNTIENLKVSLANVNSSNGLTTWINNFQSQIGAISQLPLKVAESKKQLDSLKQVWNEFKGKDKIISNVNKELGKMGSRLGKIKNDSGLAKWSNDLSKLNTQVLGFIKNLNSQIIAQNNINALQSKINSLNPNKDVAEISRLNQKVALEQRVLANLKAQSNIYSGLISFEQQEQYITEKTKLSREKLVSSINTGVKSYQNSITTAISRLQKLYNSTAFTKNSSNPSVEKTKQEISQLITKYQSFTQKLQENISPAGFENLRNQFAFLNSEFTQVTGKARQLESELKRDNGAVQLSNKIALLTAQIQTYQSANSKAMKVYGREFDSMLIQLKNPNIDLQTYTEISKKFQVMRQEIVATNSAGKTFFATFKEKSSKFIGWMSMTFMYSTVFRTVRNMITGVVELDNSLVDLKKTFKGTSVDLQELYVESTNIAKQLGVTSNEVISSASSWSRLGYNTKQAATEMAKAASIMKMISPDMDIDTANSGLISIVKAFGEIDINQIVDQVISPINEIGNNFAVSNSDILQGLQRSSAAMKMMGEDLTSTIALFTAGNEILQDASQMGNALRSVSLRVRGKKTLPPYCESDMLCP